MKCPRFDLTYSAPKSVSLLYALGDPATVTAVIDAHDRAVDAAVAYLERWACQVRRGHAGAVLEPGSGFVAGAFRHRTSREGDPNLHTHVVIANAVRAADGRWSAPDARQLYRHAKAAGAVYQAVLRRHLTEALGVGFVAHKNGNGLAEVAGVPRWAVGAFSTRRRQITAALAERGASGRTAAQVATLVTRRPKGPPLLTPSCARGGL